jgi:hypothetical protein
MCWNNLSVVKWLRSLGSSAADPGWFQKKMMRVGGLVAEKNAAGG